MNRAAAKFNGPFPKLKGLKKGDVLFWAQWTDAGKPSQGITIEKYEVVRLGDAYPADNPHQTIYLKRVEGPADGYGYRFRHARHIVERLFRRTRRAAVLRMRNFVDRDIDGAHYVLKKAERDHETIRIALEMLAAGDSLSEASR